MNRDCQASGDYSLCNVLCEGLDSKGDKTIFTVNIEDFYIFHAKHMTM